MMTPLFSAATIDCMSPEPREENVSRIDNGPVDHRLALVRTTTGTFWQRDKIHTYQQSFSG